MVKKVFIVFIILILGMLLISSTTALEDLGEFDLNQCVRIPQTCASCSFVNISTISIPNSTAAVSNASMTNIGNGEWQFEFCDTSIRGRYDVRGQGDLDGNLTSFATFFHIGKTSSTGESLLYIIFIVILFLLLLLLLYLIAILPSSNEKDDQGTPIRITFLKYMRIGLIAITYGVIIIILNLLNGLAVQFTSLTIFAGTIGFLFEIMLRMAWIFTLIMVLWIFYLLIHDSNIMRNIKKLGRFRVNV